MWSLINMAAWLRRACTNVYTNRSLYINFTHFHNKACSQASIIRNYSNPNSISLLQRRRCLVLVNQECFYSSPPQRKSIISQIVENIRQDMDKNKEMKENLKKFREETQKFEQSEALQKAKQKYKEIEDETYKGSQQIKEQLESLKGKLKEGLEEAQNSEVGRKSREITEELTKSAMTAAQAIAKQGEQLGKSMPIRAVASGVKAVKEQIEETTMHGPRVYEAPAKLQRRSDRSQIKKDSRSFSPNTEATGIELHKDSKWFQSWQNFRDNNQYVNKVFDWKMKYDESDNPVIRASRLLTDKVTDLFGGLFQKTELSEVLTEIVKIDPSFDKEMFLKECEREIIPNILEAMIRGELDILKDWCYEGAFNALAVPIKQAHAMGYTFDSKVLDVTNVDLALGKIMEHGPVLVVTFQSQQILVVRNANKDIIEGDPSKVMRVHYVWALCRDQGELDPKAAWKIIDLSASSTEQWL